METNTTITITLKEILEAIKNMQHEELANIQTALNTDTHQVVIDTILPLGESFNNVKVNLSPVDIVKEWPKSVPNYPADNEPHVVPLPYYPWQPRTPLYPYYPDLLNPWRITSDTSSSQCTLLNEDASDQMCHSVNVSGYTGDAYFTMGSQDNYLNDLLRR